MPSLPSASRLPSTSSTRPYPPFGVVPRAQAPSLRSVVPMSEIPATPAPDEVPHAPWALVGECLVAAARVRGGARKFGYPRGIRPLPGPAFLFAIRYTASPVGPFLELAVARPASLGLRPGFC